MAIELITGRYGSAHIGSEDVRAYQAYTAGSGRYVLHGGGASIQSANDVHVNPAEILIDGAHVRITGQGEDVTLDNGTSSYNRVDIVALRYLMTGSGDSAVESISLEVVKGTPSELTPSDPSMPASGSILDNVSETYVPYVRVLIQGLTPQTPEVLLPSYVNPADIAGDGDQVDPSVLVDLGSTSADTIFKKSPRPGVSGTLPVTRGGTGATSAASARSNLGITPANIGAAASSHNHSAANITSGTLAVARGGTGVTTSAAIGLKAYPVGAVYISYVSTSPASLFGGSWTAITGRFPYFNAGVGTGGSNTHTHGLTNGFAKFFMGQETTNHYSLLSLTKTASWSGNGKLLKLVGGQDDWWSMAQGNISTHTTGMGLGGTTDSGNNMPLYQTLYAWRRTA